MSGSRAGRGCGAGIGAVVSFLMVGRARFFGGGAAMEPDSVLAAVDLVGVSLTAGLRLRLTAGLVTVVVLAGLEPSVMSGVGGAFALAGLRRLGD